MSSTAKSTSWPSSTSGVARDAEQNCCWGGEQQPPPLALATESQEQKSDSMKTNEKEQPTNELPLDKPAQTLELQTTKPEPDPVMVMAPERSPDQPQDLLRLAVERGASVDTLERLMAVRRELRAEEAKGAFDAAMAAFQAECPIIIKSRGVLEKNSDQVRYRFAPLDVIVTKVRPLLQKHGFAYQLDAEVKGAEVTATCRVTHVGGHSESSKFAVPIDPKAYMSDQQKFASALTFAKRYAFTNVFGIMTGDQDNDGRTDQMGDGPEVIKKLVSDLWGVLAPVRGKERDWVIAQQWLIDECCMDPDWKVAKLDAASLRAVIAKAKAKLNQQ